MSVSLPTRRRRALLVAVGLALGAAAGCGSSGGDEIATPPSTGFTPRTDPVTSTTEAPTSEPPSSPPDTTAGDLGTPTLSDTSTISTVGLDEVHFGMTFDEAQEAAGTELAGTRNADCFIATAAQGPAGVSFVFSKGTVERVDIGAAPIATRSGAKVGSTEAEVKQLYGDQIQVQPRTDGQPGNLLVFVPKDEADQDFRLIFTTDGSTVTAYRAGRLPQVQPPIACT